MNKNDYEHSRPLDVHRWSEKPEVKLNYILPYSFNSP